MDSFGCDRVRREQPLLLRACVFAWLYTSEVCWCNSWLRFCLCLCVCVCVLQYESSSLGLISSRLRTTLNRIQESLIDVVSLCPSPSLFFPALLTQTSSFHSTPTSSSFNASIFFCLHPQCPPQPVSTQNALSVVIMWPVVTQPYM